MLNVKLTRGAAAAACGAEKKEAAAAAWKTLLDGAAAGKNGFGWMNLPEADIYCIANPGSLPLKGRLKFRVIGRRPALWDPATGGIRPLSYKIKKWKTKVDLPLDAGEEAFVVFGPVADRRKLRIRPAETENKH